jgi:nucleoid DNA-binding protein
LHYPQQSLNRYFSAFFAFIIKFLLTGAPKPLNYQAFRTIFPHCFIFQGGVVVNKAQLVEAVQKTLKSSKADAERRVNAVLESVSKGIKKDKSVQLVGFGSFTVRKRKARMGRNPQTGAKIRIKASKTVGFKPGKALKGSL